MKSNLTYIAKFDFYQDFLPRFECAKTLTKINMQVIYLNNLNPVLKILRLAKLFSFIHLAYMYLLEHLQLVPSRH